MKKKRSERERETVENPHQQRSLVLEEQKKSSEENQVNSPYSRDKRVHIRANGRETKKQLDGESSLFNSEVQKIHFTCGL